ncbi:hypothetical protein ACFWBX_26360 [Streptomyces sp. NPDC059991]|uniref:hypothetical protein n=1 Tax=Streptomyces sp. NPDC059991 TaxID=3347028 RepID=UPI0036BCC610
MSDDGFLGHGSPGHGLPDDEQALRILLERAVPQPPVPASRLDKVRERLARRRRRRAAGGAAVAVVSLVAAGALLPDALRTERHGVPPAATPPQAVTGAAGVRAPFPELDGLVLRLPASWDALWLPGEETRKVQATGFVASQRLQPYERTCPELKRPGGSGMLCQPVERLGPGGVLLSLTLVRGGDFGTKVAPNGAAFVRSGEVWPGCRRIGGSAQYTTLRATGNPGTALFASLCAGGTGNGTDRLADEVRGVLDTATWDTPPPTRNPTPEGRRK